MTPRHCNYCGEEWTPDSRRRKWHDCPGAIAARSEKRLQCVRDWKARHPNWQHLPRNAGAYKRRSEDGPNRCRRCGNPTWNHFHCSDCWAAIAAETDMVLDCLGQELGSIWL